MRKSNILLGIKSELEKSNNVGKKLLEIILTAQYTKGKSRLAFCILEDENHEVVKEKINNALMNDFSVVYFLHETIEEAIQNNSKESESLVLENNWRGRLFHQRHIDGKNDVELKEFLVKSIWRIIVEYRNDQYFTRHDIFPCFWYPGHSTGGKETFKEDFENILEQLRDDKNNRIDNKFDRIKVFASDRQNQYPTMRFTGVRLPNGALPEKFDCTLIELRENFEDYKKNLIADLNNQFGTGF